MTTINPSSTISKQLLFLCLIFVALVACGKKDGGSAGGKGANSGESNNTAPQIISTPERYATENKAYIYKVSAIDDEGDPLTFSLTNAPSGMEIHPTTGTISWIPASSQGGENSVEFSASDGKTNSSQTYTVTVETSKVIASGFISANDGGTIEVTDPASPFFQSKVEISFGALPQDTSVSLSQVSNPSYLPNSTPVLGITYSSTSTPVSLDSGLQKGSALNRGTPKSKPIRIILTYTDTFLSENHLREEDLNVYTTDVRRFAMTNTDRTILGYCPSCTLEDAGPWREKVDAEHDKLANSFLIHVDRLPSHTFYYSIGTPEWNSAKQNRYFEVIKGSIDAFRVNTTGRNLVIVHGILSSSDVFVRGKSPSDLIVYVKGFYDNILFYNYPWSESIYDNGNELVNMINAIDPQGQFDIIAHSMGGAVARWAIENSRTTIHGVDGIGGNFAKPSMIGLSSKVKNLFMLATPNWGVPFTGMERVIAQNLFGPGPRELTFNSDGTPSQFLKNLNKGDPQKRRGKTAYHLYTAKTLHGCNPQYSKPYQFVIIGGVPAPSQCVKGHSGIGFDQWSDHIPTVGLRFVDFVPVPKDKELESLGLNTSPNSSMTFEGYDHSTLHTQCMTLNGVCNEIRKVLRATRVTAVAELDPPPALPLPPPSCMAPSAPKVQWISGLSSTGVTMAQRSETGNYDVTWSGVGTDATYTLEEATNDSSFINPIKYPGLTVLSQRFSGKTTSAYYYRVMANNSCGSSGWSNTQSIQVIINQSPPSPSNPDLVVINLSVNGAPSLTSGQPVTISATVKNQGSSSSNSTMLHYYRSSDSTISMDDIQIPLWVNSVPVLSPGGTASVSFTAPVPTTTGTYWIGACVKAVSGESEITNQCYTGAEVTVVLPDSPIIAVYSVAPFNFTATEKGSNPAIQVLNIWNAGGGILSWSVSDDQPWLSIEPTSGISTGGQDKDYIILSVNTAGLSPGTYNANMTVSAPGAANPPQTVEVSLTVMPLLSFTLNVNIMGAGSGTVIGSGINCTATCSTPFASGTPVTLTATPNVGSVFTGWTGGGCIGTDTCTVTMDANQLVTAAFTLSSIDIPAINPMAAGMYHTCVLTTAGGVKCWGENGSGQLGDGTQIDRYTSVDVSGLTNGVRAISAGAYHTCALTTAGGVKCWGKNDWGQLGDGMQTDRYTPVDVIGLTNGVNAIAAGGNYTCALTTSGGVKCWGSDLYGQLGDGAIISHYMPADVSGLTNGVRAISAGAYHTCALTTAAGVKCWGNNNDGQLGDGTVAHRFIPVDVSGLTNGVSAIVAGDDHTCALTVAGSVKCWGNNDSGQLGDGLTEDRFTSIDVNGLASGVRMIAAGFNHTCALIASGGVKCWGGSGLIGDGTTAQSNTPVDVIGLPSGVSAIAAGSFHTCAFIALGGFKCWGNNNSGQLGNGTTTSGNTPVDVSGFTSTPETPIPLLTLKDSWSAITTTNAPEARTGPTAVWTCTKMIIWGGYGGNTVWVYDLTTDSWSAISTVNAPEARSGHTAVWTGSKMVIWGGYNGSAGYLNDGGVYDSVTGSWVTITTASAPAARYLHTAVWTGSKMVIWGGISNATASNTGGSYDLVNNDWISVTTTNAPTARSGHTAVWTGSKMLIWGGYSYPAGYYPGIGGVYE